MAVIRDFSAVRARGVYVLDMIAHNNDRDPDIFQICAGDSRQSLWLAYQAARGQAIVERIGPRMERARRAAKGRSRHMPHGRPHDSARRRASAAQRRSSLHDEPRSTLFNTDGQIFSDAGIPTVLFMENYDINREGYHDTQDTMANIDLDYGAAVAAIAIESVARAAS